MCHFGIIVTTISHYFHQTIDVLMQKKLSADESRNKNNHSCRNQQLVKSCFYMNVLSHNHRMTSDRREQQSRDILLKPNLTIYTNFIKEYSLLMVKN